MYYNKKEFFLRFKYLVIIISIFCIVGFFFFRFFFSKNNNDLIKGNGRIEARETSISTKFAGKLVEILADEGDYVKKGQLLAIIDSRSLESDINAQKARLDEINKNIKAIEAEIKATESDIKFSKKELDRTKILIQQNFASELELDRNNNLLEKTEAKLASLKANKNSMEATYKSLQASIKTMEINLSDMKIYAPTNGVILYRLAESGEMLPNGGKIFIMYNPDDLYMTIYMSSDMAGQVKLGEDAKIKLDAYKNKIFDAKVSFVAENAEFTPKEVETQKEREKLVFRVKLTLNNNFEREAKPGMPGEGYIKLNSNKSWSELNF